MLNFPLYRTKHLILLHVLQLNESQYEYLSTWFTDQEVCKYNTHGKMLIPQSFNHDNYKYNYDWTKNIILSVFAMNNKKSLLNLIGNIALKDIDWIDRTAEFSCIFGNKEYWGKGYCTEATRILFNHGFNKLNLNKIWLGSVYTNLGMNRVAVKLGMKREAIFEKHVFLDGKYIDIIRYRMFQNEWKNFTNA